MTPEDLEVDFADFTGGDPVSLDVRNAFRSGWSHANRRAVDELERVEAEREKDAAVIAFGTTVSQAQGAQIREWQDRVQELHRDKAALVGERDALRAAARAVCDAHDVPSGLRKNGSVEALQDLARNLAILRASVGLPEGKPQP